ncbi:MAG: rod shape-determining protein [Mycoplasmatota bacterium]
MFSKDIGIDLGTANVLIYIKGQGVVINEPSVVAINSSSNKILAVGQDAYEMIGKTPGKIKAIKPLKDGVIADFEITEAMLNYFLKKTKSIGFFKRPRILICCPADVTNVEKTAIKEAAEKLGAKKVFVEEEPKIAALGAGLDISLPSGCMVVDIGGGTTDIAVLSLGDIVTSASIKIAGNALDNDIVKYIKEEYKLLIGEKSAEEIKIKIGTVNLDKKEKKYNVSGRDIVTGLPKTKYVSSKEIEKAISNSIDIIIKTVKNVLEATPPELASDIIKNGIILTGGGSLLDGLDYLLNKELKINVIVAENALTCIAIGTGKMLENLELVEEN